MIRPPAAFVALALLSVTPGLRAQSSAPVPAGIAIPATPAGAALRTWLDAFNSGDSARMDAYVRAHDTSRTAAGEMRFRKQTGGLVVTDIAHSEPRRIEFLVREAHTPLVGYGVMEVRADDPTRVAQRGIQALANGVTMDSLRLDAGGRRRVVEGAAARLDSFYVFPDVAKRMGDSARARLARGAYDGYTNGPGFALRLDHDLGEIAHDRHLHVRYSGSPLPVPRPEGAAPPVRTPADIARDREQADEDNCGFRKAEVLEGNVGYLRFDYFAPVELCGATASAAMNFLAGTRALVVDMRENGGGKPEMVRHVVSYLFDGRTHINDLWTRSTGKTEEFWTRDSVEGRRFGGTKPVYVLTSNGTFSGGEEFTYDLRTQHRATIVGETTGGGAHPVRMRPIDEHFAIGVPYARAINPVTKTNWEGTGVEPDVKVKAADALATALKLIGEPKRP